MTDDDLQDSPICQVGMMFTKAISFRKVSLIFNSLFASFFLRLRLIVGSKRIYNGSQCMVSRLVFQ